jgi:hypothetical protein
MSDIDIDIVLARVEAFDRARRGFDDAHDHAGAWLATHALSAAVGPGGRLSRPADDNDLAATLSAVNEITGWLVRVARLGWDRPEELEAWRGAVTELEGLIASCRRVVDDRLAALDYEAAE